MQMQMFLKSLKLIKNNFGKTSLWFKLSLFLGVFLIILILMNLNQPIREGLTFKEKFSNKSDEEVFDDFYASIYDELVYSEFKNDYEIGEIVKKTSPTKSSTILDIGSGTGHHVNAFKKLGFNCIGIDKSQAMVDLSKKNYPDINVKVGDVLKSMEFDYNQFTHITCLYFTIYYIKDKSTFFTNCMNWLKPGGYLILHLVDRDLFDPILPGGDPFVVYTPQKYAKKRITSTNIAFDQFNYKSQFNADSKDSNIFPNDVVIFKEIFKDKHSENVRQNVHKLYMIPHGEIIKQALNSGFIELSKINLGKCQYENQYLYIFQKPS
jgi:ubiquinone/menaquinone biosynthesis C-methylase UbiE